MGLHLVAEKSGPSMLITALLLYVARLAQQVGKPGGHNLCLR